MNRRLAKYILIPFVIVFTFFVISWIQFLYTPVIKDPQGYKYTVFPGASLNAVISDLASKEIIHHPRYMQFLMHYRGDAPYLKAGEYLFPQGSTPLTMLQQMVTGIGVVHHAFTIIPGWNFKDVRYALSQEASLRHSVAQLTDQEVMQQLGFPGVLPEGQFYPDTYYFVPGDSDMTVLKRAYHAMQAKLSLVWASRMPTIPYKNPKEVLIAASLIEKEAYLAHERSIISSVLINRLQRDMLLQIDPTVIYGMGLHYTGKIRKEDLLENTPYNTYVHKGLPPTPIAMPSFDSMMAAVHPDNTTYLYYVARGDGSHQFSETYIEHKEAVTEANTTKVNTGFFNESLAKHHLMKLMIFNNAG